MSAASLHLYHISIKIVVDDEVISSFVSDLRWSLKLGRTCSLHIIPARLADYDDDHVCRSATRLSAFA
jgi:hypothetical protein